MGTPRGWQPENTWLFVVGALEWKHEDMLSSFPERKRRDAALVRFFRQQQVPDEQIVYLQDQQATLARIQDALETRLHGASRDALLFLYYCGHGYRDDDGVPYFTPYDTGDDGVPGWAVAEIPAVLEQVFPGSHALLAADCCYSGSLADALRERRGRLSYACLTSSSASELSTGNWTFTEGLLAGLQGHAFSDSDENEHITLAEMAQLIQDDMAFAEEQVASFVTTGHFDPHWVLAPARRRNDPRIGQRVEVNSGDEWYRARIIETQGERCKVHYYGWEDEHDEWVEPSQIRERALTQYRVGEGVEVKWKRSWYPATILEVRGGTHYISYDGYSETWNEWVASSRIRPRE